MSAFKTKPEKVRQAVDVRTLDESHRKVMIEFQKRRESLPNRRLKLQKMIEKFQKIEQKDKSEYTTNDIKERSVLRNDIKSLQEEIYDIENNISEIEYYSKIDDLLMDYYEIIENEDTLIYEDAPTVGEETDEQVTTEQTVTEQQPVQDQGSHEYTTLDALNQMKKNTRKTKKVTKRRKRRVEVDKSNSIASYFGIDLKDEEKEKNGNKSRAEIYELYKNITDNEYQSEKNKNSRELKRCFECNNEKTINHTEGIMVCEQCGTVEMIISESEKSNYKDNSIPEKPGYPYKRINHFSEWLSQIQAKYMAYKVYIIY